jgi:hypothetical protein
MQQEIKRKWPPSEELPLPQWDDAIKDDATPGLAGAPASRESIQELLLSIPERGDLERLFERHVTIAQIVQLLGRNVDRHDIQRLLDSDDVQAAIRRLLAGAPGEPRQ